MMIALSPGEASGATVTPACPRAWAQSAVWRARAAPCVQRAARPLFADWAREPERGTLSVGRRHRKGASPSPLSHSHSSPLPSPKHTRNTPEHSLAVVVAPRPAVVAARATRQQTTQLTGLVFQPFNEVSEERPGDPRARARCAYAPPTVASLAAPHPPQFKPPPIRQVKAELATVANTNAASESLARCNYKPDLEAAINEQIK